MEPLNFNPGPSALPKAVLQKAQAEFVDYQQSGLSVLEMSHRSELYETIHRKAISSFRRFLCVPDTHTILLLQGGASLQFSMIPMNFLFGNRIGYYISTGAWSEKAFNEAKKVGHSIELASSEPEQYSGIPVFEDEWPRLGLENGYLHITSNNTIYGTQWQSFNQLPPGSIVADMSSDIGTRQIPWDRFALVYAGAQKNLGPAGVTVVVIRNDWLEERNPNVPTMLDYKTHAYKNSLYNTPPTFSIYMLSMMLDWIEEQGGLDGMMKRSERKASLLYRTIDDSDGFYVGHAKKEFRSKMNATFRLPSNDLTAEFLDAANEHGFIGLSGHRSIRGCRVSLYNGVSEESCQRLAEFMEKFKRKS